MAEHLTEGQRTTLAALARMYRAYTMGRGIRLTADEVAAFITQTALGEDASAAAEMLREVPDAE